MDKKEYVSLRIPSTVRDECQELAYAFAGKEGSRVVLAHILRRAILAGLPVVRAELQEPTVPGVSVTTQNTTAKQVRQLSMAALEVGLARLFDQPQPAPSPQS